MANDIEPLLLRVHIAASLGSKSTKDIAKAEGTLGLGATGDATSTANALAEALGDQNCICALLTSIDIPLSKSWTYYLASQLLFPREVVHTSSK